MIYMYIWFLHTQTLYRYCVGPLCMPPSSNILFLLPLPRKLAACWNALTWSDWDRVFGGVLEHLREHDKFGCLFHVCIIYIYIYWHSRILEGMTGIRDHENSRNPEPISAFWWSFGFLGCSRTLLRPPQDVRRFDRKLCEMISFCFVSQKEPFWSVLEIYDINPILEHLKL